MGEFKFKKYINDLEDLSDALNNSEIKLNTINKIGFINGVDINNVSYLIDYDNINITYVDATRTITISPVSGSYVLNYNGYPVSINSSMSIQIIDIEGPHAIFWDGTSLRDVPFLLIPSPNAKNWYSFAKNDVYMVATYWNSSDKKFEIVLKFFVGIGNNIRFKYWVSLSIGAFLVEGASLNSFSLGGNGSLNAHAQFGIDYGFSILEATTYEHDAVISTSGIPIFYQIGNLFGLGIGQFRKAINPGFCCLNAPGGRLYYNKYDPLTLTWSLQEVTNNDYVLYHIFAYTSVDTVKYACLMGQNSYSLIADAREAALEEITNFRLTLISLKTFAPIATVIFKTSNTYTNAVKAIIIRESDDDIYVDWRGEIF